MIEEPSLHVVRLKRPIMLKNKQTFPVRCEFIEANGVLWTYKLRPKKILQFSIEM